MRLIWIKPNAESKLYGLLQSQFACRRNIWLEKLVRHFCACRQTPHSCHNDKAAGRGARLVLPQGQAKQAIGRGHSSALSTAFLHNKASTPC
jgi:hypothetical protein